jgi:site-specific recombinase XerD
MVHLAYTLGLRPKEISRIRLDDISFSKAELTVPERKGQNPVTLPMPEQTVKAIAAYLIGVRPKSKHRTLFLSLQRTHGPVSTATVVGGIAKSMHKAGVPGSAYWLRHTYAQHLLETGVSVFEIKMMLGHERIESTKSYLHIHTKLMREVLFDETL